jgi:hypothetical protein
MTKIECLNRSTLTAEVNVDGRIVKVPFSKEMMGEEDPITDDEMKKFEDTMISMAERIAG